MQYDANMAKIVYSNISAVSVMQHTPTHTVTSILHRIGIETVDGLIKESYVGALYDAFISDQSLILTILTQDMIDFLIEVWEADDHIVLDEYSWNQLEYLKMFGLLAYRKGNPLTDSVNEIHVIEEMKDQFYFHLKSHRSRKKIQKYHEWERLLSGFLYYYGLIEIPTLYEMFSDLEPDVEYEEFERFLYGRSSLWGISAILSASNRSKKYFALNELENPDLLLMYLDEHKELPYKKINRNDLCYISEAGGIDNRWAGVSELGTLLVDEMNLNLYRATMVIRNLINMIHNNVELSKLYEQMEIVSFQNEDLYDRIQEMVDLLYNSVPVFEYKGENRRKFEEFSHELELKKKRKDFKIVYINDN